ncbi:BrnA antitoxin family protein [Marinomonas sp.]|uniref:BrnA antitoxin family protein n=1 Tax=Marinomonas sp. TaxID=1904862 RepID=UPI003BA94907
MRDHYDFKNPYAKKLKKQVTIRLDEDTVEYFKALADDKGIPYQSLINLYLRDCAQSHRVLKMEWQ